MQFRGNMLQLFDLHCDTLLEVYNQRLDIKDNTLHISLKKAKKFSPYVQVCSIWSDSCLTNDEAFSKSILAINHFKNQDVNFITEIDNLKDNNFILGIEDARLLNCDLSRLDTLFNLGVRVLTLNWKGASIIGGGWDTSLPLTNFGISVIERCKELGIVVDLSHSSEKSFFETIKLSKKLGFIPIASHSNSFTIYNHKRNLSDKQFEELRELKSIVGISFVSNHLGDNASIDTIIRHINYFMELGGEDVIALGSDFDGTDNLPNDIHSLDSMNFLHSTFLCEFGKKLTNKISSG